jgi:hypothetical protein
VSTIKGVFWNEQQHRLRSLWRLVVMAIMLAALSGLASLGLGLVFAGISSTALIQQPPAWFGSLGAAGTLLAVLAGLALAGRFPDRRRFADFGFHLSRDWWLDLGFGLVLGALLMTGIFTVERAAGWVTVQEVMRSGGEPLLQALLMPTILFVSVGIYEEAVFRGYILRNLAEGFNLPAAGPKAALLLAWLVSSAAFGLIHYRNPNATVLSSLNIALAGVLLGSGFVLSGELAIPIGLHITWNFFQGSVYGFAVSGMTVPVTVLAIEQGGPDVWTGGPFGPEAGLLGLMAVLAGTLLIAGWLRWRRRGGMAVRLARYRPPGADPPSLERTSMRRTHNHR